MRLSFIEEVRIAVSQQQSPTRLPPVLATWTSVQKLAVCISLIFLSLVKYMELLVESRITLPVFSEHGGRLNKNTVGLSGLQGTYESKEPKTRVASGHIIKDDNLKRRP